ncbi:MAG TPA: imidazolonepropionase [Acidimicrobiales bacterium]|nr:imidazolonepropionase [Acidimicrobiales bacterium]
MVTWDLLVTGARLATMTAGWRLIDDGVVAVSAGRIAYAGPAAASPVGGAVRRLDVEGRLVTPGLVDCHTHLVFAGDRAGEMEQRLAGLGYEDIAAAGGGILATVRATRAAGDAQLLAAAAGRLRRLRDSGVTTVEVKSGYGLDLATELRMLGVARRLGGACGVTVRTTFLGAHVVPPEYAGHGDDYVHEVIDTMLPAVVAAGLADAVDVFCEQLAFTPEQAALVLGAARRAGLLGKVHADQLSDGGGAALAAAHGAVSADHLEYASPEGVAALAASGTVAVLLPGAAHVLGSERAPPIAVMRALGVPMAVATDANPGTSPLLSMPLAMHLACVRFGLTPDEALAGATVHAAAALGLTGQVGVLAPGAQADLVVWDAERPVDLVYWLGADLAARIVVAGRQDGEGD